MLRLIAKQSVMCDVEAPGFRRVCRAFDYCWKLAYQMENVEVGRYLRDPRHGLPPQLKQRCDVWREREKRKMDHLQRTIAPTPYMRWKRTPEFQQKLLSLAEKKELHSRSRMLPAQQPPPPPPPPPPAGDNEEALAMLQAEMQSNAAKMTVVQAKLSQCEVDASDFSVA